MYSQKFETYVYRLLIGLRSTTWTTVSEKSEDESKDGFENVLFVL